MKKCFICGSRRIIPNALVSADKTTYCKCSECGLLFQPKVNYLKLKEIYGNTYRIKISFLQKIMFKLPFSIQYIPNFKFLKRVIKIKGSMLDIGSSCGKFMYLMRKRGWKVQGIEPTKHYADFANNELQVNTFNGFVEEFETKELFDFINCCAVLEHVENPESVLTKIHEWIKKDRPIFIGIPLGIDPKNGHWDHLYLFNKVCFSKLVEKTNFKIVKLELIDNHIHAIIEKND